MPGFAMGLRRTGMAPYAGTCGGCAMTAACIFDNSNDVPRLLRYEVKHGSAP